MPSLPTVAQPRPPLTAIPASPPSASHGRQRCPAGWRRHSGSQRPGRRGACAGPTIRNARGDRREPEFPRADFRRHRSGSGQGTPTGKYRAHGHPCRSEPIGSPPACLTAGRLADWDLALAWRPFDAPGALVRPRCKSHPVLRCARALSPRVDPRQPVSYTVRRMPLSGARLSKPAASAIRHRTCRPECQLRSDRDARDRGHRRGGLGDERRRALRTEGAAMSMDEAIAYALANIDQKLLAGPIASIDR